MTRDDPGRTMRSMERLRNLFELEVRAAKADAQAEELAALGNALRAAQLRQEAARLRACALFVGRQIRCETLPSTA